MCCCLHCFLSILFKSNCNYDGYQQYFTTNQTPTSNKGNYNPALNSCGPIEDIPMIREGTVIAEIFVNCGMFVAVLQVVIFLFDCEMIIILYLFQRLIDFLIKSVCSSFSLKLLQLKFPLLENLPPLHQSLHQHQDLHPLCLHLFKHPFNHLLNSHQSIRV